MMAVWCATKAKSIDDRRAEGGRHEVAPAPMS